MKLKAKILKARLHSTVEAASSAPNRMVIT